MSTKNHPKRGRLACKSGERGEASFLEMAKTVGLNTDFTSHCKSRGRLSAYNRFIDDLQRGKLPSDIYLVSQPPYRDISDGKKRYSDFMVVDLRRECSRVMYFECKRQTSHGTAVDKMTNTIAQLSQGLTPSKVEMVEKLKNKARQTPLVFGPHLKPIPAGIDYKSTFGVPADECFLVVNFSEKAASKETVDDWDERCKTGYFVNPFFTPNKKLVLMRDENEVMSVLLDIVAGL